ncbi:MAG: shikimate dehydrogenase [Oscillospiraceae bacterium]|jgi:shikimate dehydrogenase|nr:shikimate dehydrogenase [Oscillospiraceae bacterium]
MQYNLYGVLGRSLPHTLSPQLHGALYDMTGHKGIYNVFEVEPQQLKDVIPAAKTLGIRGFNVTIPYKKDIMVYLDAVDPMAQKLGAVNTVKIDNGVAHGFNTDYYGFPMSLLHAGIDIRGKSFLMCGVSGAGLAIREALLDYGASDVLAASTDPKKGIPYNKLHALPHMDVIINCTPLGMYPDVDASVVGADILGKFETAVDIVYNPVETFFLKTARRCGLATLSGLYMLIFQGIKSFEIWTGIDVDTGVPDVIFDKLNTRLL